MANWDVFHGDRLELERGLTTSAIREALARGDLRDDDLVRPAGTTVAWTRLADMPQLLEPAEPRTQPIRSHRRRPLSARSPAPKPPLPRSVPGDFEVHDGGCRPEAACSATTSARRPSTRLARAARRTRRCRLPRHQ